VEIRSPFRYLLAPLFALSISAQTGVRFGPLEIPHIDPNEIQIRQGGKEWRIDLTNLIRVNDCFDNNTGKGDERICDGPPKSPCPGCPNRMVGVIAWDQHRQKLYFIIGNGGWQQRPWTVFNYNLATRRVTRFSTTSATTIGRGAVSSSGQYLAYVQVFHCSPAYEGHCASDVVEVMDLWNGRVAHLPSDLTPNHDVVRIERLTWSSSSTVDYAGSVHSFSPESQPEHPTKGSIELRDLQFH
jgi:hypothetical protein